MIRHQVRDDGVLITMKQSWGTVCATLTESEAKRLAWSILSDLDPDEVEAIAPRSAYTASSRGRQRAAALNRVKPPIVLPFTDDHDADLIRLYNAGDKTFTEIGKKLSPKRTRGSVAGRVDRLRRRGLIT